ncbi:MAG: hypothetical protein CMF55_03225 [Legionellales bacterium]|nr:hypothetical protein [Legionellales bacterium]|tara:strand:- start:1624 stop:1971 length:348 start_codon:yes stop_codon:yes gene_type:complete
MIDTDKYEGHTRGPWRYYDEEEHDCWVFEGEDIEAQARVAFFAFTPCEGIAYLDDPDLNLMIDAPLLLAEVERLREEVEQMRVLKILKENERLRERVATLESLMEYMADEEKVIE